MAPTTVMAGGVPGPSSVPGRSPRDWEPLRGRPPSAMVSRSTRPARAPGPPARPAPRPGLPRESHQHIRRHAVRRPSRQSASKRRQTASMRRARSISILSRLESGWSFIFVPPVSRRNPASPTPKRAVSPGHCSREMSVRPGLVTCFTSIPPPGCGESAPVAARRCGGRSRAARRSRRS